MAPLASPAGRDVPVPWDAMEAGEVLARLGADRRGPTDDEAVKAMHRRRSGARAA